MVNNLLNSRQCEAARSWLRWTREQLADKSKVSVRTIARFESDQAVPGDNTLHHLRRAFEDAGIEFIFDGARGVGMRTRDMQGGT